MIKLFRRFSVLERVEQLKLSSEQDIRHIETTLTPMQKYNVYALSSAVFSMNILEKTYLRELLSQKQSTFSEAAESPGLSHRELSTLLIEHILQDLIPPPTAFTKSSSTKQSTEEATQEQNNFDVVVTGFAADSKIKLIREVKSSLNVGLREAKEQVDKIDNEPLVISKAAPKEKAQEILDKLLSLGVVAELRS